MISLLNRREVTVTHDMNRLNQLREKLDGAGIEHIVRNKRNRTFTAGRSHGVPMWMRTTPTSTASTSTATTIKRHGTCSFNRQRPWSMTRGVFVCVYFPCATAARRVFSIKMARVMGPQPPGTGVM